MREFDPIPAEENVTLPASLRQTLLSQFDKCPRSGYLSLRYGGGTSTPAQTRGTIFHEMAERATKEMINAGDTRYDPTLARDLVQDLLVERTDLVVPVTEHESLRSMAWNWGKAFRLDLENVQDVEAQVYLDLYGVRVHGTMDLLFLERGETGTVVRIKDYKTGFVIPKQEEFERQFQGQFYGLLAAEGSFTADDERVAKDVEGVYVHQVYPRHYNENTGKLEERVVYYPASDLASFKVGLQSVLAKIEEGQRSGNYPAQAGNHCGLCPAPHECPIPANFRPAALESADEAGEVLSVAEGLISEANRLKGDVRTYAEANDIEAIPLGADSDQEYAFTVTTSEVIADKPALKAALAAGEEDTNKYFTTRTQTRFAKRKRSK